MAISKNTIIVKTFGRNYEERDAGEAGIYPGMLCKKDTDGDVIMHDTEGGRGECLIAIEDALQGKLVSTVYVLDYPVRLMIFRPGEEFCGLLAIGETISDGEQLISAGDGTFKSAADSGLTIDAPICIAMEDEDTTGVSGAATLIHMRAL